VFDVVLGRSTPQKNRISSFAVPTRIDGAESMEVG